MRLTELLIIPDKNDAEREAVATAWAASGGEVLRLGRFWDPPVLDAARVRLYGNDTFCLVLAQKLGLDLVSPADDLLARIPQPFLLRELGFTSLDALEEAFFPRFVKPLVPKLFRAAVYPDRRGLLEETAGLPPETGVMTSEIVAIQAEARAFLLDGEIQTCALYEGGGDATEAAAFLTRLAASVLPQTCVLDAGFVPGRGWVPIEANATWGAGLNGCDPVQVLPCILAATRWEGSHPPKGTSDQSAPLRRPDPDRAG